jgi:hypothetical protein
VDDRAGDGKRERKDDLLDGVEEEEPYLNGRAGHRDE